MIFCFADVASVQSSRGFDFVQGGEEPGDCTADTIYLGCAGGGAWPAKDGAVGGEHGSVFDKGGVGMLQVDWQRGDVQAALRQGFAVSGMLLQHCLVIGRTQVDGGEPLGEVGTGRSYDGLLEHGTLVCRIDGTERAGMVLRGLDEECRVASNIEE